MGGLRSLIKNKKILIVGAHPDDEVLGCGGTVARLIKEGHEAYALILGEGITSRDEKRNREKREKEIVELRRQIDAANGVLGVKEIFTYDFPDNRFDTIPLLDIVKVIEKIKKTIKPDIIFTHFKDDLNVDHRVVFRAVITAARPVRHETVKEIYSFEILSCTEWNYPTSFSPDVFFDISGTINIKLKAMGRYKSELRKFPHPRSLKGIRLNAEHWGTRVGLLFSEAFESVRVLK